MILAVSGFKGGTGKTTTSLHLAGFLARRGDTLLVDADRTRSALKHADRGPGLPYQVMTRDASLKHLSRFEHVVFDMGADPDADDLADLAEGVDLLVLPSGTPDLMNIEALDDLARLLHGTDGVRWRVLVNMAPPPPQHDGEELRDALLERGVPVFRTLVRRLKAYSHAANAGALVVGGDYHLVGEELLNA